MKTNALLLITALLMMFFISCKKEENSSDFEINGVENLNVRTDETKILDLNVTQTQGPAEDVRLSLDGVPDGILCSFETSEGKTNFTTSLSIIVTNKVKLGNYNLRLNAVSEKASKSVDLHIIVDDEVSMVMNVFDASLWSPDHPSGEPADSAIIRLYADSSSFKNADPCYTTTTDENGVAYFYHVSPKYYLFTVEKKDLSNISSKKIINGKSMGLVALNVNKNGNIIFRDQNGDGLINDLDRTEFDVLVLYKDVLSAKYIWIGK